MYIYIKYIKRKNIKAFFNYIYLNGSIEKINMYVCVFALVKLIDAYCVCYRWSLLSRDSTHQIKKGIVFFFFSFLYSIFFCTHIYAHK